MQDIIQRPQTSGIFPLIVIFDFVNLAEKSVCVYLSHWLRLFGTEEKLSSEKRLIMRKQGSLSLEHPKFCAQGKYFLNYWGKIHLK